MERVRANGFLSDQTQNAACFNTGVSQWEISSIDERATAQTAE